MSYDYEFILLTRAIDSLRECSESAVSEFDDWQRVYDILRQRFPALTWRQNDRGYRAHANQASGGRFEIVIDFDTSVNAQYKRQYGMFRVRGSHHAEQLDMVRQIAEAVNFSAFDWQNGECIYLQGFDQDPATDDTPAKHD